MSFDGLSTERSEATQWIINQLKTRAADDIYCARAWLLTAKTMLSDSFELLYETYVLESKENNVEQCARLLCEMFERFPNEPLLRTEIENMIMSLDKLGGHKIFDNISADKQKQMLVHCIEGEKTVAVQCKMALLLMQNYPETVMQYGVGFAEKLGDDEKRHGLDSPLNQYRKLLVCDVLPVLCSNPLPGVSQKQFYKWLQKAIEFYATYLTSSLKVRAESVGKLDLSWENLEALRKSIALRCDWDVSSDTQLNHKMAHIKDLHRKSRLDVTGKINKKQIFYTAIQLLLEAAAKYAELMQPQIYEGVNQGSAFINLFPWDQQKMQPVSSNSQASRLHELFHVAENSYHILSIGTDAFSKDFGRLYRRWKMERWIWFNLFLLDLCAYEGNHNDAVEKINKMLDAQYEVIPKHIVFRFICVLTSSHFALKDSTKACSLALKCLQQIPEDLPDHSGPSDEIVAFSNSLSFVPLTQPILLSFWIHIFITRLALLLGAGDNETCSDEVIGHAIVLSQHEWPKWREIFFSSLEKIQSLSTFSYPLFSDYVTVTDILEEFALLRETSECHMKLSPDGPEAHQRVTRGLNRNANAGYNSSMNAQVNRGEDCVNKLLLDFLKEQQILLVNL